MNEKITTPTFPNRTFAVTPLGSITVSKDRSVQRGKRRIKMEPNKKEAKGRKGKKGKGKEEEIYSE